MKALQQFDIKKIADVNRLQTNIDAFTTPLLNNPLLDGVLIEDVALTTTATKVNHTLGRAWRGWIITDKNAQRDIWATSTALDSRFLTLTAAGAVTASIWVF